MISDIKEWLKNFFTSRLFVLGVVIMLLFAVVIGRVFTLQIVMGSDYQENFQMLITQDISINATRGNIYDCNGKLLAYDELAYTLAFSDEQRYKNTTVKNESINAELSDIINEVLTNGDTIELNGFGIDYNTDDGSYSFNLSGSKLKRFLADVFGASSYDDLSYNDDYGFNEASATADQVMEYLEKSSFGVNLEASEKTPDPVQYDEQIAYYIVVIRYALLNNYYSRYVSTTISKDISDETKAYINEHSDTLLDASIEETTIRRYNYSEYFSGIVGYTGTISEDEYTELHDADSSYTRNDTIGRSGLEKVYEQYLRGTNGTKSVYVDNLGRISSEISRTDAVAGNDVYISIDADLQEATYKLLEQEIAGILYGNIKEGSIPITDVYFALINNSLLDVDHFGASDASSNEQEIYSKYSSRLKTVLKQVKSQLYADDPKTNNEMSDEMLDYVTYIIKLLKNDEILLTDEIDTDDEIYQQWSDGKISPEEYLNYCISQQWVDFTLLDVDEKYADSSEIYDALVNYILADIEDDTDFAKIVYEYLVKGGSISGKSLCLCLFDQGVLDYDDNSVNGLTNGTITPYQFLLNKIDKIEITPAQLALDPCTGSCVITDVNTGEIKAMVSYPGYDNNMMANGVDADYYAKLQSDLSNPLYNYATQEKTACGSTFKMVTATAGLAEGIISTSSEIECNGVFDKVDNKPECWIYQQGGTHGSINVSEALRDSCNVFFYTCGYDLSFLDTGSYNDATGIKYLTKYASIYGLNEKTGIEIEENSPDIATEYPVMAAIGQSNNNYTTISLSRYVTAVASQKKYTYTLMDKITDKDGNVITDNTPTYEDISDTLNNDQWTAIYKGMRMVCETLENFDGFDIAVAGKTGTAQQVSTRPNHALFVGYAPYNNPEVSIATRISYGSSSHNAAGASRNILTYYFGEESLDDLLSTNASGVNTTSSTSNGFTD